MTTPVAGSYDPNESQAWRVITSTAVGFSIATLAILGRLVSRWLCRKRLELNDALILIAYVFKLGIDIASVMLLVFGIGRHVDVLSHTQLTNYLKTEYVGSFLYCPTIGFTKLSILSLYRSAFPSRYMNTQTTLIGLIVIGWAVACCLAGLLACLPIHKVWDLTGTVQGHCIDYYKFYYGIQIPNIITDVWMIVVPWKAVLDLHLPRSKTLLMMSVLMVGILTLIFDIIRLDVLVRTPNTMDFSWNQVPASVWTDLEPSVAILAACMPICRPLLAPRQFWKMRKQTNSAATNDDEYDLDSEEHDKLNYETHQRDISSESATYE